MNTIKKVTCIIMLLALVFSFAGCNSGSVKTESAPTLDLKMFYEEYCNNQLAAEEKYFGQKYRVTTEVDSIYETSVEAGHYIPSSRHGGGKLYFDFSLKYKKNQKDFVLALSVGDRITFEGTLTSFTELTPMTFEDVVFIVDEEDGSPKKELYNQAVSALDNGETLKAAMLFGKASGYEDAKEKSFDLWHKMTVRETIAMGYNHTVGIKKDGTVVATKYKGDQYKGQCDVGDWTDIVSVSAADTHTIGLKTDGTVCAVGDNDWGQCNVEGWTDIIAISTGSEHTVGLKSDGTVVATSYQGDDRCDVSAWTDIVAVAAGYHTVGLKSDGTVVAVGDNDKGQCDVESWTDIVGISAGGNCTAGLKSDGTVVAVGLNSFGQCDVYGWRGIVDVSTKGTHTVGVRDDGTVVAVGYSKEGQCNVYNWTDIVAVATVTMNTVGLKADGTVVAVGENGNGELDIDSWYDIKLPDSIK